jgi:hypothetical protein
MKQQNWSKALTRPAYFLGMARLEANAKGEDGKVTGAKIENKSTEVLDLHEANGMKILAGIHNRILIQ